MNESYFVPLLEYDDLTNDSFDKTVWVIRKFIGCFYLIYIVAMVTHLINVRRVGNCSRCFSYQCLQSNGINFNFI